MSGQVVWRCRCGCGRILNVNASSLTRGISKHCLKCRKPSRLQHGQTDTRLYYRWCGMIGRCHSKTNKRYPYYGARGISVCDRWRYSFENFKADMGDFPEGTTLDRIDNNGNYEPGNCRWATMKVQSNNRRKRVDSTLDDISVRVIRECIAVGFKLKHIGDYFKVSGSLIWAIKANRRWAHVV
jgi:hypothetical protein